MNYVNRQVAQALKEAGFDVPCIYQYFHDSDKADAVIPSQNHNQWPHTYSAPDFLTAADWITEKSNGVLRIDFMSNQQTVVWGDVSHFDDPDHRNTAIIFALNQLKEITDGL